jgi:GntR family transcriptional repressor for pyruvate dehydrogenase complex
MIPQKCSRGEHKKKKLKFVLLNYILRLNWNFYIRQQMKGGERMLTPIKTTKVYEQVIEQIKGMIASGTLKKGDKLPSERDLVEQLQVSRTSIREALRAMEIIGLIECRQGGGNYVRESFENNLFEPLSVMFMLEKRDPSEIIELRKIIEVENAALAAQRITEEELEDIGVIIENLKNSENEEIAVKFDKQFHYAIAKASKNTLILAILNAVSSLIDDYIKDARTKILAEESNRVLLSEQHEKVYLALKKRDAAAAVKAMNDHLDFANEYMSGRIINQSLK